MRILFKYATRSRPRHFERGIRSITQRVNSDNYIILVSIDSDDNTMKNKTFDYPNTMIVEGKSKNKIDAINRDFEFIKNWDILVNMSDDMTFIEQGFDDIIRAAFTEKDLFIHFPDGNRKDLATMSIMDRTYYERFNYVYHPDYISLYCDNEAQEVAQALGRYKYVDKTIFNHLHPAYGKGVFDSQYARTESYNGQDRETYLRRKQINFEL